VVDVLRPGGGPEGERVDVQALTGEAWARVRQQAIQPERVRDAARPRDVYRVPMGRTVGYEQHHDANGGFAGSSVPLTHLVIETVPGSKQIIEVFPGWSDNSPAPKATPGPFPAWGKPGYVPLKPYEAKHIKEHEKPSTETKAQHSIFASDSLNLVREAFNVIATRGIQGVHYDRTRPHDGKVQRQVAYLVPMNRIVGHRVFGGEFHPSDHILIIKDERGEIVTAHPSGQALS
jgi:hypothetical protein